MITNRTRFFQRVAPAGDVHYIEQQPDGKYTLVKRDGSKMEMAPPPVPNWFQTLVKEGKWKEVMERPR